MDFVADVIAAFLAEVAADDARGVDRKRGGVLEVRAAAGRAHRDKGMHDASSEDGSTWLDLG